MDNSNSSIFCTVCQVRMKRQVLGSNIFYYCQNCGCLSSDVNLSKITGNFHAQEPLSIQKTPVAMDLKLSRDDRDAIVEA